MNRLLVTLAVTLILGACQTYPGAAPFTVDAAGGSGASVVVRMALGEAPGFHTLGQVTAYGAGDINHVMVQLFTHAGAQATEAAVKKTNGDDVAIDVPKADLAKTIRFTNLKPATKYRVRAYAYKASGTDAANLISTTALSDDVTQRSYVDLDVTDVDTPTLGTLRVRLIDRSFDGQTTSSGVLVTPGGLTSTANEAIVQN